MVASVQTTVDSGWTRHVKHIEFPIRDPIAPMESGNGYLLRMAGLNSLAGIYTVKRLLENESKAIQTLTGATELAHWFGTSSEQLHFALGISLEGCPPGATVFGGQVLSKPTLINRSAPRVCPQCLRETGFCRLSWDFGFTTVCPIHRVNLIDHCASCKRRVLWSRPRVTRCSCLSEFLPTQDSHVPHVAQFELANWIELKILANHPSPDQRMAALEFLSGTQVESNLMKLVWPLSLNAGLLIVTALSTAGGQNLAMTDTSRRAIEPMHRARLAIIVADELAKVIALGRSADIKLKCKSSVVAMVAECISTNATQADRNLAYSLLSPLLGHYRLQKWSGVTPQLSQLEMF